MTEQQSKRRAGTKASSASGPPRRRQAIRRPPTSGGMAGRGSRAARRRAGKKKLAADPKGLAQGVFARVDAEQTAVDLLRGGDKRLKVRVFELLLAYAFGKPAQRVEASGPSGGPIRMIWDIPAPERERAPDGKGEK